MIEIKDLTKRYGSKTVVDNASFTAVAGRVTGFLGPNGAGKSTTLKILLGLVRAERGTALIDGMPYTALRQPLKAVGAMLDGVSALPERRGIDHLKWIARSNRVPTTRIDEVLELVGLMDVAKKRVKGYSLGMKQRLGLAAAMLGKPRVLILDEPVNGLDAEGIRTIRLFLRQYADQGNIVLLSSHLMGEVAETVDDVVVINEGRIIAAGTIEEIVKGYSSLEDAFFALTRTGNKEVRGWI